MKKLLVCGGLSFFFASVAVASIAVGRGEISVGASAIATYDSNLSGREGSESDYYGTFAPRISYTRRAGKIVADASLSLSVNRYRDHTEFNSEDVSANITLGLSQTSFPNRSGTVAISYRESFIANVDLNQRIKTNSTNVNAATSVVTGPRTSLSVTGSYFNTTRVGASDQETFTGDGNFTYKGFLDDTSLSVIYGFTSASSSGENLLGASIDQTSHSFSAALSRALYREVTGQLTYGYRILNRSAAETITGTTRETGTFITANVDGPFLPRRMFPKIQSHASISYSDAQTPGVNDAGDKQISGDIGLTWDARQTTSVSFSATRSQRLAASDLTAVSSRIQLTVQQQFRHNLSGTIGAAYNWETYRGIARSDKALTLNSGLTYSFGRAWSSSATYDYTSNSSSLLVADFVRSVATLTIGYSF